MHSTYTTKKWEESTQFLPSGSKTYTRQKRQQHPYRSSLLGALQTIVFSMPKETAFPRMISRSWQMTKPYHWMRENPRWVWFEWCWVVGNRGHLKRRYEDLLWLSRCFWSFLFNLRRRTILRKTWRSSCSHHTFVHEMNGKLVVNHHAFPLLGLLECII